MPIDKNKYLYIYSNIFFVKGYARTMIYDSCSQRILFMNNSFYAIIENFRKYKINEVVKMNNNLDVMGFVEYMLDKNFASIVNEISSFPKLEYTWNSANQMENAIIDVNETSNHDFRKISKELQYFHCAHLEIRIFYSANIVDLSNIAKYFCKADFNSVDFIVKYNADLSSDNYLKLAASYPPISFFVYGSPYNHYYKSIIDSTYHGIGFVYFLKQNIKSTTDCGVINRHSFCLPSTVSDFTEGILKNRCLNRKISITADGMIKNCPCMSNSYGNVNNHSIVDIFLSKDFRKYWNIRKDEIHVCKDCEYRYLCSDCRAFLNSLYEKPSKCMYNPYKQKWEK